MLTLQCAIISVIPDPLEDMAFLTDVGVTLTLPGYTSFRCFYYYYYYYYNCRDLSDAITQNVTGALYYQLCKVPL